MLLYVTKAVVTVPGKVVSCSASNHRTLEKRKKPSKEKQRSLKARIRAHGNKTEAAIGGITENRKGSIETKKRAIKDQRGGRTRTKMGGIREERQPIAQKQNRIEESEERRLNPSNDKGHCGKRTD